MAVRTYCLVICLAAVACCGCTSFGTYVHNGFRVGPNYCPPSASVEEAWIDSDDSRVRRSSDDLRGWWTVFNDPQLNELVQIAYEQNLTLREAGYRILAARSQLGIARGNFFPQRQTADGSYIRGAQNGNYFNNWNYGFTLAWEVDVWGRYRRAIEAGEANLDASVHEYDAILVTLLGDVATNYVTIRTTEERIRLAEQTIELQRRVLRFIEEKLEAGAQGVTDLDQAQALANLRQSEAQVNGLNILLRQSQNNLCILLGMPPADLDEILTKADIPQPPEFVVVGLPAQLLSRRPDLRQAERLVAVQAEQVGIAEADWYPSITINGTLGWSANSLGNLFTANAFNSSISPGFTWNILNYGRIFHNVELQEAILNQRIVAYQSLAIQAQAEAENGIINFLESAAQARTLEESVEASSLALDVIVVQYEAGLAGVEFNRYATILQTLLQQQDAWAQARGSRAQGLIDTYRALGGGWEIRLGQVPDKIGILSDPQPAGEERLPREALDMEAEEPDAALPAPPIEGAANLRRFNRNAAQRALPRPQPAPPLPLLDELETEEAAPDSLDEPVSSAP